MKRRPVEPPYQLDAAGQWQWTALVAELNGRARKLTPAQRWRLACLADLQASAKAKRLPPQDCTELHRYRRELGLEPWQG